MTYLYKQEAKVSQATAMTKERMGEIALMYVRNRIRKEPTSLDPAQMREQIGNVAKELNISYEEAAMFSEKLLCVAFHELLVEIVKN